MGLKLRATGCSIWRTAFLVSALTVLAGTAVPDGACAEGRSQLGPNGPIVERASQFLWTRQLHPAAFSVRHIPAAFSIDAKGPTMAR